MGRAALGQDFHHMLECPGPVNIARGTRPSVWIRLQCAVVEDQNPVAFGRVAFKQLAMQLRGPLDGTVVQDDREQIHAGDPNMSRIAAQMAASRWE